MIARPGPPATRPDVPDAYDICVRGHLDAHWAAQLGVPELIHVADGTTLLRGVTLDQAALHGLLQRIRDLGVPLVFVCPASR